MILEFCRLVLDRPGPTASGLVYLAETTGSDVPRVVARSSVFHPDVDLASHRRARDEIEAQLACDGWTPMTGQPWAVVGVRFQRLLRVDAGGLALLPASV